MQTDNTILILLLTLLGLIAVVFCAGWARELTRRNQWRPPTIFQTAVGSITNFFDTLGIGSFATTTSIYRLRKAVDDEKLPGTLTVGHTIPTLVQAFIYTTFVRVEIITLVLLIAASVLGAWLGAGVVTKLPRRRIQLGMGVALLAASGFILGQLLFGSPQGKRIEMNVLLAQAVSSQATPNLPNAVTQLTAVQQFQEIYERGLVLEGWLLAIGIVGNFIFGALMTIGIGAYAPIMVMVSLLGMNPTTAFPIMMGSCAFLMPVSGAQFIRKEKYDARAALGLALGGIPAVLLAAFIVKSLPLDAVRWLVVIVVVYTAITMLLSARRGSPPQPTSP